MIEKAPIVSQIAKITKCAPFWSGHNTRQMRQCRGSGLVLPPKALYVASMDATNGDPYYTGRLYTFD